MNGRDRLGRRREPGQSHGLRSLYPRLPQGYRSQLMRIAMTTAGWERFEAIRAASRAPSAPRAYGEAIEWLLERAAGGITPDAPTAPRRPGADDDWQRWQIWKERMILDFSTVDRAGARRAATGMESTALWN